MPTFRYGAQQRLEQSELSIFRGFVHTHSRKGSTMRKQLWISAAAAATLLISGCATTGGGMSDSTRQTAIGAGAGALAGAALGAMTGGKAGVGAVAGAAV